MKYENESECDREETRGGFTCFFLYFDKFTISATIAIFTSAVLPTLFPRPPTATIFLEEISFKKNVA